MQFRSILSLAVLMASIAGSANADVVALWDFTDQNTVVDNTLPDGVASVSDLAASGSRSLWNTSNPAGSASAGANWRIIGLSQLEFTVTLTPTTSLEDVQLSFWGRQNLSSVVPYAVTYSEDGGATFTSMGSGTLASQNTWAQFASDSVAGPLSGDSNGDIVFRIITSDVGSGNVSVDDVTLTANVVPEPATLGLLGLGGFAVLLRRRA